MSDLALFVAAALRDKTVADMKEENDKLREELRRCRAVEVTGPEGQPVYARAQFDNDGRHHDNPNLWEVKFPTQPLLPCPLEDLGSVEVRIGGMVTKARFKDDDPYLEGFLNDYDPDEDDPDNGKVVNFCFGGRGDVVWVKLLIHGWPTEQWQGDRDTIDPEDLLRHLMDNVASQVPAKTAKTAKTVSFSQVCFGVDAVKGIIDALPMDLLTLEHNERRKKENFLLAAVVHHLRSAGNDEAPTELMPKCWEIVRLLKRVGVEEEGSAFDASIEQVVHLFESVTRNRESAGEEDGADGDGGMIE